MAPKKTTAALAAALRSRWMKFQNKASESETIQGMEVQTRKAKWFESQWHWLMDYLSETNRVGVRMDRERAAVLAGHLVPWLDFMLRGLLSCLVEESKTPARAAKRVPHKGEPADSPHTYMRLETSDEMRDFFRDAMRHFSHTVFRSRLSDEFIDWVARTPPDLEGSIGPRRRSRLSFGRPDDIYYVTAEPEFERASLLSRILMNTGNVFDDLELNVYISGLVPIALRDLLIVMTTLVVETVCDVVLMTLRTEGTKAASSSSSSSLTVKTVFEAWARARDVLFGDVMPKELTDSIDEGIRPDLRV